jgi:hypothetical protein
MPKKKNLPIPFFSKPNKGIRRINERYFEIGLSLEEQATEQKAQDHVLQLEEEIRSLSHAKEQLAHLKAFRDYLSGHCVARGSTTTIISCSALWKKKECSFDECDTRRKWESLFF